MPQYFTGRKYFTTDYKHSKDQITESDYSSCNEFGPAPYGYQWYNAKISVYPQLSLAFKESR